MFYIVGCNHGIQVGTGGFAKFDSADQNEQRAHFMSMLEEICTNRKIKIVLEEDGGPEETAAEQIADRHDIPWHDINTSNEDKDRLGIPRNYVDGPYIDEEKNAWHRQREEFMVERINEYSRGLQNVLVVCGFEHMPHIAELLEQKRAAVEQIDYRALALWYRAGIFAGDC